MPKYFNDLCGFISFVPMQQAIFFFLLWPLGKNHWFTFFLLLFLTLFSHPIIYIIQCITMHYPLLLPNLIPQKFIYYRLFETLYHLWSRISKNVPLIRNMTYLNYLRDRDSLDTHKHVNYQFFIFSYFENATCQTCYCLRLEHFITVQTVIW